MVIDKRENDHAKNKKCNAGRYYGASCGRTGVGSGYAWPDQASKAASLAGKHPNPKYNNQAQPEDPTIAQLATQKIKQAEQEAPHECADKKKCCARINLTVTCLPSASMAAAKKNDPEAVRACKYTNTYECPKKDGSGAGWKNPLF